jgi:type VI secretion system protein ImpC
MNADADFSALLTRPVAAPRDEPAAPETLPPSLHPALAILLEQLRAHPELAPDHDGTGGDARLAIEAINAEIDLHIGAQLNLILHHPEFQALEATWRGVHYLARTIPTDNTLKIRLFNISRRELARTLRKFRGTAWDQSPIFKKVYEEEYGQFGGEPFGLLIGEYAFDHQPEDIQVLADMAAIAAAAHAPFIAAAAPSLMHMESWAELANPREITRLFLTPEYTAWRSLREAEDSRYLGLALPRVLGRLPYGILTDPVDAFAFEEAVEAADTTAYLWMHPAFAVAANIALSFSLYGWCARFHGIETGGLIEDLPSLNFPTADGDVDVKCATEIALGERREAELARCGLIPIMHRKNTDFAAIISAHSLQKPVEYEDPAATANAVMSARLPYLFASCRFAHFLKCMVRDKVGGSMSRGQLQEWLTDWISNYVDGSPGTSNEAWKASHPLEEAGVVLEAKADKPGQYEAKFFLRPHYQLEGLTVALRLVSRLPAQNN